MSGARCDWRLTFTIFNTSLWSFSEFLELSSFNRFNIQSPSPDKYREDTILQDNVLKSVCDVMYCCRTYKSLTETIQCVVSGLKSPFENPWVPTKTPFKTCGDLNTTYIDRTKHGASNSDLCNSQPCSENEIVFWRPGSWSISDAVMKKWT